MLSFRGSIRRRKRSANDSRFVCRSIGKKIWKRLPIIPAAYRTQKESILMRILFCDKYNFPFSGTEVYLFELMELAARSRSRVVFDGGSARKSTSYDHHFVPHFEFKTPSGTWSKVQHAAHAIYSTDARRRLRAMIRDFRPDVAHVRNIYPPSFPFDPVGVEGATGAGLYHINDFKLLCPSYNMVSQGEAAKRAKGARFGTHCGAMLSRARRSATLAAEALTHRWLGTYRRCVDLFLGPSQFVRTSLSSTDGTAPNLTSCRTSRKCRKSRHAKVQTTGRFCTLAGFRR